MSIATLDAAARDRDFNDLARIIKRQPNAEDRAILFNVSTLLFPEKLKLSLVSEILEASCVWSRLTGFEFGAGVNNRDGKEFSFGQFRWLSTIKQHDAVYESAKVPRARYNFINAKFPNDGYVYSPEFEAEEGHLQLKNEESQEFATRFMENLRSANLFKTKPMVYSSYQCDMTEFAIYCVDIDARQIFTAEFHHGRPVGKAVVGSLEDWAEEIKWKYDSQD